MMLKPLTKAEHRSEALERKKRMRQLYRCTFCGHRAQLRTWDLWDGCPYCGQSTTFSFERDIERVKQRKGAE